MPLNLARFLVMEQRLSEYLTTCVIYTNYFIDKGYQFTIHGKGLGLCLSNFYGRGMGGALEGHWRGTGPVLAESFHKSCTKSTILNFWRYDLNGFMQLRGAAGGQPKTLPAP